MLSMQEKTRSFINATVYDLETVQLLLDYGRIKETVPIVCGVFDRIRSESLVEEYFQENHSLGVWRLKLEKFCRDKVFVTDQELKSAGYVVFLENFFPWALANISKLKNRSKPSKLKNIERLMLIFILIVLVGGVGAFQWTTRDWGLKGYFYQGIFDKYLYSGHKKNIDFDDPIQMDHRLPDDYFSVRWQGDLLVPKDGKYTILAVSDDGARVFLDGKLLIDDWGPHPSQEASQEILLSQGPHPITVEYYQIRGDVILSLYWAVRGGKKEIIPARFLRQFYKASDKAL